MMLIKDYDMWLSRMLNGELMTRGRSKSDNFKDVAYKMSSTKDS